MCIKNVYSNFENNQKRGWVSDSSIQQFYHSCYFKNNSHLTSLYLDLEQVSVLNIDFVEYLAHGVLLMYREMLVGG